MLAKVISGLFGGGIKDIGDAIDKNVTSDEERLKLKNNLRAIETDYQKELEKIGLDYEKELSSRHKSDMNSDSVLSKNIRPASLIFLLAVVSLLALFDGNIRTFSIKVSYVSLFENLLLLAFGFYFGSRGVEKVVQSWRKE